MSCGPTICITTPTSNVVVTTTLTNTVTITTAGPQGPPGSIGSTGQTGPAGPTGASGPPKSITIALPQNGDEFTLFNTQYSTTLSSVIGIVRGTSSPSVTLELRYASDRSTTGTLATTSTTVTSTTTGDNFTVQNMPIPANNFLWVKITVTSGSVQEVSISVKV
jgi:hypothetical protein